MGAWLRRSRAARLRREQRIKRQELLLANMNLGERKAFNILVKLGIPFYAQLPLHHYFADFVGADRNFIIEIDGSSHLGKEEYDQNRDTRLSRAGFDTFRLWSDEVTEENIQHIIDQSEHVGREEMNKRIEKAQAL